MTSSDLWDEETASRYDRDEVAMFAPAVLDPAVEFLSRLAGRGPALELAVGTGRVAIPLAAAGVPVTGVDLSPPMLRQLRRRAGAVEVPVVIGDMATSTVPGAGRFSLVYLVWNSISNLRTQDEQVACFANAARHLRPGGRFVIELEVPGLRRLPPGQTAVAFRVDDHRVGIDVLDTATQQGTSHHYRRRDDGAVSHDVTNFRYLWPAECDLMARLAGLELEQRVASWDSAPFTAESAGHVSVWRKPSPRAAPGEPT